MAKTQTPLRLRPARVVRFVPNPENIMILDDGIVIVGGTSRPYDPRVDSPDG